MIVYIDFPQVICYATYSIVVFLTLPLMGILLLNNDKWAS
ncbi:putative membrane protein [Bacteroides fragilis str. 3998T(B)3]|uniref:Putative membrane protein n=1 Tax=Bacteroides fragilis str. 3998T(B)3 TaxID=1339316 RepID=A0A015VYU0_BACFG|nr:putative membrane protein [Bacteroides fragilis str. 3998T(B)3]